MDNALTTMESALILDPPAELLFCGPLNCPILTVLTLKNPSEDLLLFKIKITFPKRYCVRPNYGFVSPHSEAKVDISLLSYDPAERNRHKFMVQTLKSEDGVTDELSRQFTEAEAHKVLETKLKCVFQIPALADGNGENVEKCEKSDDTTSKCLSDRAKSPSEELEKQFQAEGIESPEKLLDVTLTAVKRKRAPSYHTSMDVEFVKMKFEEYLKGSLPSTELNDSEAEVAEASDAKVSEPEWDSVEEASESLNGDGIGKSLGEEMKFDADSSEPVFSDVLDDEEAEEGEGEAEGEVEGEGEGEGEAKAETEGEAAEIMDAVTKRKVDQLQKEIDELRMEIMELKKRLEMYTARLNSKFMWLLCLIMCLIAGILTFHLIDAYFQVVDRFGL